MVVKQCFSIVTQTLRRRVTLWNKRDTRKAFLTLWYSRSTKNNLYMQEFHLLYSENQTTSAQNILVRHRVKIEKIASSLNTIFLSSLSFDSIPPPSNPHLPQTWDTIRSRPNKAAPLKSSSQEPWIILPQHSVSLCLCQAQEAPS
jgi:hypothetical protein